MMTVLMPIEPIEALQPPAILDLVNRARRRRSPGGVRRRGAGRPRRGDARL